MPADVKLLPCPHCGGNDIAYEEATLEECGSLFSFGCRTCPGMRPTIGQARDLWNKRAPVEITDAMVERACESLWGSGWPDDCEGMKAADRMHARAALAAALNQPEAAR